MTTVLLLSTLALGAPATPRVGLTETLRYETRTTSGGGFGSSWSQTDTASRSKATATFELPLAGLRPERDTAFEAKVGELTFRGTLGDDPGYREGGREARLAQTTPADAKGNRLVTAKAALRWTDDRLTGRIETLSPQASGAVAMGYKDGAVGPFEGVSRASVRFGPCAMALDLRVKGRIGRKTVDVEGLSGSATTVDLRGEGTGAVAVARAAG